MNWNYTIFEGIRIVETDEGDHSNYKSKGRAKG